jgi:predicted N-acetyltransferase YhbS
MSDQITVRPVTAADVAAIEALHDRAFGPGRYARTAYRVREVLPPFSPLCRLALRSGAIVAAVRMAPVVIGERPGAQLLGPLGVEPANKGQGFGKALVSEALAAAKTAGNELVLLVGDMPYYQRFDFAVAPSGKFDLGGPVDPVRLLCAELVAGALDRFGGRVRADYGPASC